MPLTKIAESKGNITGITYKKSEYEGYGYHIKITNAYDITNIIFTPIKKTPQPDITYKDGQCIFNFTNVIVDLNDVEAFIDNIKEAKDLINYINVNIKSLLP